jgi:hypothetical protein
MPYKRFTRRDFISRSTAAAAGTVVSGAFPVPDETGEMTIPDNQFSHFPDDEFIKEIERLPVEESYGYHKYLSTAPVHIHRRDPGAMREKNEMSVADEGWSIVWDPESSDVLKQAVYDFQDYMITSQDVKVFVKENQLKDWQHIRKSIIVGTVKQMPQLGKDLENEKDYVIQVAKDRIVVCGTAERGAMFGLYNLEARMNLREAPFLPLKLNSVRKSIYDTRMVLSWMGWMEFPDQLLSHLVHDGFDSIYASAYANPNGDVTTAETSTEFYARLLFRLRKQDPAQVHDLIRRASIFGIKVYAPIIYQYLGTPESESGLRRLVRNIVNEFPEIRGYILLTEGFWYMKWGGGHGASREYIEDWAIKWSQAVGIVEEECHRINPSIEILPWEYNIDFRPENVDAKRFFIKQLPRNTIPMLTFENGKRFEMDGMKGYLRDYSLSQVGPAEVTAGQIDEAGKRGMKVYSKVDTFATWQFGTMPYLPCPQQFLNRYYALERSGIKGTLESWSSGYKPNFICELRAWTCWSDPLSGDELLRLTAQRIFGREGVEKAIAAWDCFSQAIRLVPDTGPNMGNNNSAGNPIFLDVPPLRTCTFYHSWTDSDKWKGYFGGQLNPYWPFTVNRMVFYPDFTNKTNKAEEYARLATGIEADEKTVILPVFLKYLNLAAGKMEEGLKLYREAALSSPPTKHRNAVREVIVAEQMKCMMRSNHAILEFEDLRLKLMTDNDPGKKSEILSRMKNILKDEISRTELTLLAVTRDSRLGFQFEQDYVFTPYSLKEKLALLDVTLNKLLPEAGRRKG